MAGAGRAGIALNAIRKTSPESTARRAMAAAADPRLAPRIRVLTD
jgi:hypothetical protein